MKRALRRTLDALADDPIAFAFDMGTRMVVLAIAVSIFTCMGDFAFGIVRNALYPHHEESRARQ